MLRPDAHDALSLYLSYYILTLNILKILKDDGWILCRMKGSHRQFVNSTKSGTVTVSGKPSDEVALGTLNSILKQAGLK